MAIVDRRIAAVGEYARRKSSEVRLVQLCFDFYMIEANPGPSLAIAPMIATRSMTSYAKRIEMVAPHRSIAASSPRKMDDGFGDMPGAGWLNASSPGYNGSVAFLSAGSFIRRTSLASCSSPASSSSSDDFEIGSSERSSRHGVIG